MLIYSDNHEIRNRLTISGIVQGVGFRPFICNLAKEHGLSGFVRNIGGKVQIEIEGQKSCIDQFTNHIRSNSPKLAYIKEFRTEQLPVLDRSEANFYILDSETHNDNWQLVPPDATSCSQCLNELFNKKDRRFQYPFINCTNCGPRFTIIKDLPYDRQQTTMHKFKMCAACLSEYQDPLNRRFHAQPIACADCGPTLIFKSNNQKDNIESKDSRSIIEIACQHLHRGEILAIKSLGGFHLACDATNELVVNKLRQRKNRQSKPFALMIKDLNVVQKYCQLSKQEKELLNSPQSPIVLLEKLDRRQTICDAESSLANNIAPGTHLFGVMLPYTPLHYLLAYAFDKPLVMTSGNINQEPIVIQNREALKELAKIADCFILHNRKIANRYDDSISRIVMSTPIILRRSRGLAPIPIEISTKVCKTILAFGGHLKNTFCFLKEEQAFISPHIGDLDNLKTIDHFEKMLEHHRKLFRIKEELVACDIHPDYVSSKLADTLAQKHKLPLIKVQHHHAHIVSCMTEHNITRPVIGVAFDGTGFGTDGTVWGGEFLIANLDRYTRSASFEPVIMPGGTQAIHHPWRMALSFIQALNDQSQFEKYFAHLKSHIDITSVKIVQQQIDNKFNSPLTSSCGRLFDAVSSLLGICHSVNYEGQAAIELETAAMSAENQMTTYSYAIVSPKDSIINGSLLSESAINIRQPPSYLVKTTQIIAQIMKDKTDGVEVTVIAKKFHYTVAKVIADLCILLREQQSINDVCLSGGVFQNNLLLRLAVNMLRNKGFAVYFPQKLPANDGGVSLGQAVVAAAQTNNLIYSKS